MNLSEIRNLSFDKVDKDKFPCLELAYLALEMGGTAPAVLNAANEVAVDGFLNNKITFLEIPELIKAVLSSHQTQKKPNLSQIMQADGWARERAMERIKRNR